MIEPLRGFDMQWRRLGNEGPQNFSSEDQDQSRAALAACVADFESNTTQAPREAIRVVQLLQCMRDRGWSLTLNELVIVTGA